MKTIYFADSHAHLTTQKEIELGSELERARQSHVKMIVNICTDNESLEKGLVLSKEFPQQEIHILTVASTTPHDVQNDGAHFFPIVEEAAKNGLLAGIGETGLDYYYAHSPKELQKEYLRNYLRLAGKYNLPVVIHCREAWHDFFTILDEENAPLKEPIKGVLHCFTGNKEEAQEVLKRGFYLSLSGIVTFKKSLILQEVAAFVPLDALLIETDSPYLAPQTRRGKKNEPAFVVEVAEKIAEIKGCGVEEVANATLKNTACLFLKESK
jgi:TatD DNase family protein